MAMTVTYSEDLSRYRIEADNLGISATYAIVDRSLNGGTWTVVRGGQDVPVESATMTTPVDDYEFPADAQVTYRVRSFNAALDPDELQVTYTTDVTTNLDVVWLKFIARPFLNQRIKVVDWSDIERPGRTGVFDVVGRLLPVAVLEVHGSRRFAISVVTETLAEADDLELSCALGFPVFLHAPPDCGFPTVYAVIGDFAQRRLSRRGTRRLFELPLTEVAAPGPDVVGSAGTWAILLNNHASWDAVRTTYETWGAVAELIGSPSDIIVGA